MNRLLKFATEAHGGLDRWNQFSSLTHECIGNGRPLADCQEQISYFDPNGLLRRHEYVADVMGGARGLNYAYNYRNSDGFQIPTTRRVVGFDENKRKIPEPVLVAIDIRELAFP